VTKCDATQGGPAFRRAVGAAQVAYKRRPGAAVSRPEACIKDEPIASTSREVRARPAPHPAEAGRGTVV